MTFPTARPPAPSITCPRCHRTSWNDAQVVWTLTERGKRMAVNLAPDVAGNTAVRITHTGSVRSRSLLGERPQLEGTERRHVPHAATCGKPTSGAVPARADGVTPLYLARERRAQRGPRPTRGGRS